MSTNLTPEELDVLQLAHGGHNDPSEGVCLLEAVALFAGEPHTDHPRCVDSFLISYGIRLNDSLGDADRQKLKPFIPRLVGTAGDGLGEQRKYLAIDWAVRTAVPRYLDVAELPDAAAQLRALAPVTDEPTRLAARRALDGMYDLTWEARLSRRRKLREIFRAEFAKTKPTTVDEYAVVVVVAAAAEVAEVAVAAVAAEVAEVAEVAVAAEVAAAAAAAAEAAAAGKSPTITYGDLYWPIRRALRDAWTDETTTGALAATIRTNTDEGIQLLGRLIDPKAA